MDEQSEKPAEVPGERERGEVAPREEDESGGCLDLTA
jgi:hypothetical protein